MLYAVPVQEFVPVLHVKSKTRQVIVIGSVSHTWSPSILQLPVEFSGHVVLYYQREPSNGCKQTKCMTDFMRQCFLTCYHLCCQHNSSIIIRITSGIISKAGNKCSGCTVIAIDFIYDPNIVVLSRIPASKIFYIEFIDADALNGLRHSQHILVIDRSICACYTIGGIAIRISFRQYKLNSEITRTLCSRDRNHCKPHSDNRSLLVSVASRWIINAADCATCMYDVHNNRNCI